MAFYFPAEKFLCAAPESYEPGAQPPYPANIHFPDAADSRSVYEKSKLVIFPGIMADPFETIIEASFNNIPVLGGDLPGIREASLNQMEYCKPRDVDDFKENLSLMLKNYEHYVSQTQTIYEKYNLTINTQLESLNTLIALKSEPPGAGKLPHVVIIQKSHMHTEVIPALLEALGDEAVVDVLKQPDNWANWIEYSQTLKSTFNVVTESEIRKNTYDVCVFVSGRESRLAANLLNPGAKIIRIAHWLPELHTDTPNSSTIALCPFLKTRWALPVYSAAAVQGGPAARWEARTIGSVGFQKLLEKEKDPIGFAQAVSRVPETSAGPWKSLVVARDDSLDARLEEAGAAVHHNLPTKSFVETVSKCTYLCTACPPRSTYRADRLCGTIVLAISHGIPLVIDKALAESYRLPPEACLFYDPTSFDLAILATQTEPAYLKMAEAMTQFKEKCFRDQKEQWRLFGPKTS